MLLKRCRTRRGLTQQQLAAAIGVHRTTIGRWEEGSVLPGSKALVLELARHLKLDDQETRQLLEASLTTVAPYWSVPFPRNPYFTGREEILEALHTRLGVEQAVALTQSSALHGLGGVGKTQIALEYAYRHALEYSAVFWIGAETDELVVTSFLRIAEALFLPERGDKDQQRVVAAVHHWLTTHGQWLLIWDNVEDLDLLDRFLPPTRQGAILLTTRRQALGTLALGMDLLPMEREEGMLFLLRRAKVLEPEATHEHLHRLVASQPAAYAATRDIVTVLGGLPLALDQAGAYIEETGCSLADYFHRYEQQHAHFLSRRGRSAKEHPQSVTATFHLSMEQVKREQPAAAEVLQVCAFLHSEAIPEELFVAGAAHLGPALEALAANPSQFDEAIATLRNLSFVQRQAETRTYALHRLVQTVLREEISEEEQAVWRRRVVAALNTMFPETTTELPPGAWGLCERLLPHILICAATFQDDEGCQECVEVVQKAASYHIYRTQYDQAKVLYQRALRMGERMWGWDHPLMATSLSGLAVLFLIQGKYEQAEVLYQRALRIREQALGPEHLQVGDSLSGLAVLFTIQGKYEQAEAWFQRALRIRKQALGPEHLQVGDSLSDLAVLFLIQGKYEQAEAWYQRALRIREQALGPEHLWLADLMTNLGELSLRWGRYEQAEALSWRAVSIWERTWGPEHICLACPLDTLAALFTEQRKYEQARALYECVLGIQERVVGPEHPKVALTLHGLATLSYEQGRYEQAEPLLKRARQIQEQYLGPDHPAVAQSLNSLARLAREQGRYAEAEWFVQRALSIREQHLGQDHPDTAQTLHDLALLRQKQSNVGEAIPLAERALAIRSRSLGDAHPKTISTQTFYTQLLQEQAGERNKTPDERSAPGVFHALSDGQWGGRTSPTLQEYSGSTNDPLQGFLDACCERHPRAWCRSADLWQAYGQWVAEHQERFPLSRRAFAVHLKAHGCRADHTHEARIWHGITLVKEERRRNTTQHDANIKRRKR